MKKGMCSSRDLLVDKPIMRKMPFRFYSKGKTIKLWPNTNSIRIVLELILSSQFIFKSGARWKAVRR